MSRSSEAELLSRYLDDDLEEADRRRLEAALERDPALRRELEGLRAVVAQLGDLERPAVPLELGGRVARLARLEARRTGLWERGHALLERHVLSSTLLPAFAVVLALGAILYVLSEGVSRLPEHGTRLVVAPGEAVGSRREVAGRLFAAVAGGWREVGLESGGVAPRRVAGEELADLVADRPELRQLAALGGAVQLRLDGEPVTLVFEEP